MLYYFQNTKELKVIKIFFSFLYICCIVTACGKSTYSNNDSISLDSNQNSDNKNYLFDPTLYGILPNDFIKDKTEKESITTHEYQSGEKKISYVATVGHLVTLDPNSSKPNAKMFYVAFTANNKNSKDRPITFIYDGGPGTTSMYQLLGGFSPKVVKTSYPNFTPPGNYILEDNPDCLLDKTDLVYINAVGTAYSTAIYPFKNKNFWGVDEDAQSFVNFIKRYLNKYQRWDSPKFLMGLSYGTIRSPLLAYLLHKNAIDLNGITLISTILSYKSWLSPIGQLPSFSAAAWYYDKIAKDSHLTLEEHLEEVSKFAVTDYASHIQEWNRNYKKLDTLIHKNQDHQLQETLNIKLKQAKNFDEFTFLLKLSNNEAEKNIARELELLIPKFNSMPNNISNKMQEILSIDKDIIKNQTELNYYTPPLNLFTAFPSLLLQKEKKYISFYDARSSRYSNDLVDNIDYLVQDPLMNNTSPAFHAGWFLYIEKELRYKTLSNFTPQNMFLIDMWNYKHVYPKGNSTTRQEDLFVTEELAATMNLNPNLKVFQAGGYFDFITPYFQTTIELSNLPIVEAVKSNIEIHTYPSGHLIFLDKFSRKKMKSDLEKFYDSAVYKKK